MTQRAALRFAPQPKLALHSQFADYMAGRRVYPINVEISPSGVCQASCDFCLVSHTMIDTPNGLRPIQDVRQGDIVFGPDGLRCFVTNIGSRETDEIYAISVGEKKINATGEHPFLTGRGWVKASDLRCGDAAAVRVRMRRSGGNASGKVEQVCEGLSSPLRTKDVAEKQRFGIENNEGQEPHEKSGSCSESISTDQRETDQKVGRRNESDFRSGQKEDVVGQESHEGCGYGASRTREDAVTKNVDVREEIQGLGRGAIVLDGAYGIRSDLDRSQKSRLQSMRPEESDRVDAKDGLCAQQREDRQNGEELRHPDNSTLQKEGMELLGDIFEARSGSGRSAAVNDHQLCVAGIELERGLELRRIDSVRRIKGRFLVYNFSCSPTEAYEANGFIVHNCFYANTGELGSHRKVFLDKFRLFDLFAEMNTLGVKSVSWTGGGDPSLHPHIDAITAAAEAHCLEQGMFTNALAMPKFDPKRLSWVRITMTDKPCNEQAILALRPAKTLGFAFNYSGPKDYTYLIETLYLADRVGADYVQIRPALHFHGQTVNIQPPDVNHPLAHITWYKFEEASKKHGYERCEGYHLSPFVWEDGNVDVCSYMRLHKGYNLGNIYKETLKDILDRSPAHVDVHKNCQVCCRLHETNKMIHESRKLEDRNFP